MKPGAPRGGVGLADVVREILDPGARSTDDSFQELQHSLSLSLSSSRFRAAATGIIQRVPQLGTEGRERSAKEVARSASGEEREGEDGGGGGGGERDDGIGGRQ